MNFWVRWRVFRDMESPIKHMLILLILLASGACARAQFDSSAAGLLRLSQELYASGRIDSAAFLCGRAITADSSLTAGYDLLGRIAADQGDCAGAGRLFTLGLRRDSTSAALLLHAAQSAQSCGLLKKSEELYRRLLADGLVHSGWTAGFAQVLIQRAEYDSAIAWLDKGVAGDSTALPLRFLLGSAYAAKKQFERAIPWFQRALAINGSYFPARKELASCYMQLDSFWNAAAEYRSALALQPDDQALRMNLANCYLKVKQYRQALELLATLEASAYIASVYAQEGLCYYFLARYDSSAAKFRASMETDSTLASTPFNLGLALMSLGRHRDAIRAFEKAVLLGRSELTAGSYDRIGSAWYALKRKGAALRAYRKALEEKPSMPIAWFNLGVLYENSYKERTQAVACYRNVVRYAGSSDEFRSLAQRARERIALLAGK